jgi:hypothetical protein
VKIHELNLVSHVATRQNAQNTFTTVQRDEVGPACAPQLSGPHEITIQVIMSIGPEWVLFMQEQGVRFL